MSHVTLSVGATKASDFAAGPAAVEFSKVSFSYSANRPPAVENVTLRVEVGERLGILGPNGGGKSTLINLSLGLLAGHSGTIRVFGDDPKVARTNRLIGYVPQRSEAELGFPLSAREVVELTITSGMSPFARLSMQGKAAANHALEVVGATEFADYPIGRLSGGQLQRIAIARAIVMRPRLLLLDEPTVGIDVAGQKQFADLLERLSHELKLTIIVVSHDIRTIAAGCDRVACLARTLHSHGTPEGLTPAVLAEVFRHDMASIFGDLHVDAHAARNCTDPTHRHGSSS